MLQDLRRDFDGTFGRSRQVKACSLCAHHVHDAHERGRDEDDADCYLLLMRAPKAFHKATPAP